MTLICICKPKDQIFYSYGSAGVPLEFPMVAAPPGLLGLKPSPTDTPVAVASTLPWSRRWLGRVGNHGRSVRHHRPVRDNPDHPKIGGASPTEIKFRRHEVGCGAPLRPTYL